LKALNKTSVFLTQRRTLNGERLFAKLAESENDPPSFVLMRRCAELRVHPPKPWEGIFHLETK